jgi:hypothetical protein
VRAIDEAERRFGELVGAGYIAAKRTGDGTSELLRQFDPTAQETLFIPRLIGGWPISTSCSRPRPRTEADKRELALLRSWLTPEQDRQWAARYEFEVVGCDTGTRCRITYRAVMNVHELDPDGHPVKQWCFIPEGGLAIGDVLLAEKIALETIEREALVVANSQPARV